MDINSILVSLGPAALIAVGAIVFVENGLLFPFLPGDSLVFAAALLAGALHIDWLIIALVAAAAACAGGEVGYSIGRRFGPRLFTPQARILKTAHLEEAERFFARWGRASLVLGRFVPIVRTFIAPAAAAASMPRSTFSLWNAISAVLWAGMLGLAGALFGSIPWVAHNVELIALGIIVVTVMPVVITALVRRRRPRSVAGAPAEEAVPTSPPAPDTSLRG